MDNPQTIANNFMAAYGEDANWVYGKIKDECLFIFGDARSHSVAACDWIDIDADSMELWIIENIVSKLEDVKWPNPHTKTLNDVIWNACHREFMKG